MRPNRAITPQRLSEEEYRRRSLKKQTQARMQAEALDKLNQSSSFNQKERTLNMRKTAEFGQNRNSDSIGRMALRASKDLSGRLTTGQIDCLRHQGSSSLAKKNNFQSAEEQQRKSVKRQKKRKNKIQQKIQELIKKQKEEENKLQNTHRKTTGGQNLVKGEGGYITPKQTTQKKSYKTKKISHQKVYKTQRRKKSVGSKTKKKAKVPKRENSKTSKNKGRKRRKYPENHKYAPEERSEQSKESIQRKLNFELDSDPFNKAYNDYLTSLGNHSKQDYDFCPSPDNSEKIKIENHLKSGYCHSSSKSTPPVRNSKEKEKKSSQKRKNHQNCQPGVKSKDNRKEFLNSVADISGILKKSPIEADSGYLSESFLLSMHTAEAMIEKAVFEYDFPPKRSIYSNQRQQNERSSRRRSKKFKGTGSTSQHSSKRRSRIKSQGVGTRHQNYQKSKKRRVINSREEYYTMTSRKPNRPPVYKRDDCRSTERVLEEKHRQLDQRGKENICDSNQEGVKGAGFGSGRDLQTQFNNVYSMFGKNHTESQFQ